MEDRSIAALNAEGMQPAALTCGPTEMRPSRKEINAGIKEIDSATQESAIAMEALTGEAIEMVPYTSEIEA